MMKNLFTTAVPLAYLFGALPMMAQTQEGWNEHTIRASDVPADAPRFEDYPARLYNGPNARPLIARDGEARPFRTRIRDWARQKPNFAGHYILATWGCGSLCTQITFIDAVSGKIIMQDGLNSNVAYNVHSDLLVTTGNLDWHAEGSIKFKADSRLLVVIGEPEERSELRGISYFVMRDDHLDRVRFVSKPGF
jgi:hypothetical protein